MASPCDLVGAFVAWVNASPRKPALEKDVPPFLRSGQSDSPFCDWKIVQIDASERVRLLERKLPMPFPPAYRSLISRYAFPAFEAGRIFLFGNTGESAYYDLSEKLFADEHMSKILMANGFLQFGNPQEGDYDPVCFDTRNGVEEPPIVRLDHEDILCNSRIRITEEIANSFSDFLRESLQPC
jgi:hypothetical protein